MVALFDFSLVTPYSTLEFRVLNHFQIKADQLLGVVSLDLHRKLTENRGACKYNSCCHLYSGTWQYIRYDLLVEGRRKITREDKLLKITAIVKTVNRKTDLILAYDTQN